MELVAVITPYFSPKSAFMDPGESQFARVAEEEFLTRPFANTSELRWNISQINPKNMIHRLGPTSSHSWRVDGCSGQGRQFYALPVSMLPRIPVRRIEVFLPCQSQYPAALRRDLQCSLAFNTTAGGVNTLKLFSYIENVLDTWSRSWSNFPSLYHALPFGSKIVIENVSSTIKDVKIRVIPNEEFEQPLIAYDDIQTLWGMSSEYVPPKLGIDLLEHVAQPYDSISIVQIPCFHGNENFVLKTNLRRAWILYHELKLLLRIRAHPHIIPPPLYIVTILSSTDQRHLVIGFILKHYAAGNLGDILSASNHTIIRIQTKFTWSKQIIETIKHIIQSPASFYSELKPQNLLVSDSGQMLTFIDFEQAGIWYTFSAPEIFYLEWMAKLARFEQLPEAKSRYYHTLLLKNGMESLLSEESKDMDQTDHHKIWMNMTQADQEAAMVYSIGKVLWCIFEEASHTRNSLEENYAQPIDIEFPQFSKTPTTIRRLIERCTSGSPEWKSQYEEVSRLGTHLVPSDLIDQFYRGEVSPMTALHAARKIWLGRVQSMERYLEARIRFMERRASVQDEQFLGFSCRPSLNEVLAILLREEQTREEQ